MSELANLLVTTFHYVIREQNGNDVTVARAKSMLALVSITWPQTGIIVEPHYVSVRRVLWKSSAFDSVSMGGSFRRDPVGDDASIIIDYDEPPKLTMLAEMEECAAFIPLFGRQALDRFNLTLSRLFIARSDGSPLPLPGSKSLDDLCSENEYRNLFDWLLAHKVINAEGTWQTFH